MGKRQPKREIEQVEIGGIDVGFRLRAIDQGKVDALKASIGEIGLKTAITVRMAPPVDGDDQPRIVLVAGAHRLEAARQLGHWDIPCIFTDADEIDAELWEIDENLCRADLTTADRAIFIHRRKDLYLQKHPETANGAAGKYRSKSQLPQLEEAEPAERFTLATAKAVGVSEQTIQRDVSRGEKISEALLRRLRGTRLDTGVTLDRIKHLPADLQEAWVNAALADEKRKLAEAKEIRTARLIQSRTVRTGIIAEIAKRGRNVAGEMPRRAFPILYADPPWQQESWSDETGQDKGLMYPSMPLAEIMALCAGDRSPATPDAKLYLWVPANRLDDGIAVLKAWGFDYVSCIVWDKVHIGMGREVRDRTEFLLIGKRGGFPGEIPGTQPESLYSEVKTSHSRKPVWFAELIDRLYPELPKLELFQRAESLQPGDIRLHGKWSFWGFEAHAPAESEVA